MNPWRQGRESVLSSTPSHSASVPHPFHGFIVKWVGYHCLQHAGSAIYPSHSPSVPLPFHGFIVKWVGYHKRRYTVHGIPA